MSLIPRRFRLWRGVRLWGPIFIALYVIVKLWSHAGTPSPYQGTEKDSAVGPYEPAHDQKISTGYLSGVSPQALADYLGTHLQVEYEVVNNLIGDNHQGRITLLNSGRSVVPSTGWTVYFYNQRMIERDMIGSQGYALLANLAIKLKHINGGLFSMAPTDLFPSLHPGSKIQIMFTADSFTIARTDIMPNWYVVVDGAEPRVLQNTAGESLNFVAPFSSQEKWKRFQTDHYDPFTPETRYQHNEMEDLGHTAHYVIPSPAEMNTNPQSKLEINQDWVIIAKPELYSQATLLSESTGLRIQEDRPDIGYIHLVIVDTLSLPAYLYKNLEEAYTLHVNPTVQNVVIHAQTTTGVYYGVQTLLSLMEQGRSLPQMQIRDAPQYSYRGIMVDLARNFIPLSQLLRLIKLMSMYKMNKLHLHLTDDEAWRLDIPGLPELTKVGSLKCHDFTEDKCVLPSLGSGPKVGPPGSGHLSSEQYGQLLRQARAHHIQVIPEIDMPGHARAAIKSMMARYRSLTKASKMTEAKEFLLTDLEDKSTYESVQLFSDNVINPCINSTYKFITHVVEKLVAMHRDIQPLKTFHFGGDEVPGSSLLKSPACDNLLSQNPHIQTHKNLQEYFVQRVANIAAKYKLTIQGWEDGFYAGKGKPYNRSRLATGSNMSPVANAWMNRWEWGRAHRAYELANDGYKEPDPEERGMSWATRYVDTRKVFSFIPDNLYENIDEEISGKPLTKKKACDDGVLHCLPLEENSKDNIIGIQGQLWGEQVRTGEQMFSQLVPRMLALAERAWHQATWQGEADDHQRQRLSHKDWQKFANTLGYKELKRLERLNIPYYLPPPGAVIEDGELKINSAFPGLVIQYSDDEGDSWHDLVSSTKLSGTVLLSTRSHNEKRRSRPVSVFLS